MARSRTPQPSTQGTPLQSLSREHASALAAAHAKPEWSPDTKGLVATGKAGDFEFLTGSWHIRHRRLKERAQGKEVWDEFEGEATCYSILEGRASIEELRIPARNFSGMGIRILSIEKRLWCDYWVNGKFGVLTSPSVGVFEQGVGTFLSDDEDAGKPIIARGVWDQITARSCRWHQSVSRDGGTTWEHNWFMDWTRV